VCLNGAVLIIFARGHGFFCFFAAQLVCRVG
jgi:hypothetical protein